VATFLGVADHWLGVLAAVTDNDPVICAHADLRDPDLILAGAGTSSTSPSRSHCSWSRCL
jgi:hypothetical protein